jgi:hypothetical protein
LCVKNLIEFLLGRHRAGVLRRRVLTLGKCVDVDKVAKMATPELARNGRNWPAKLSDASGRF